MCEPLCFTEQLHVQASVDKWLPVFGTFMASGPIRLRGVAVSMEPRTHVHHPECGLSVLAESYKYIMRNSNKAFVVLYWTG